MMPLFLKKGSCATRPRRRLFVGRVAALHTIAKAVRPTHCAPPPLRPTASLRPAAPCHAPSLCCSIVPVAGSGSAASCPDWSFWSGVGLSPSLLRSGVFLAIPATAASTAAWSSCFPGGSGSNRPLKPPVREQREGKKTKEWSKKPSLRHS
jgi:hypothetical protein